MKTTLQTSTRILIAMLVLNVLISIGIASAALFNPAYSIGTGFGVPYTTDMAMLGTAIGMQAIFFIAIMVLSIFWTIKRKIEGPLLGLIIGVFMFLFGIVVFLQFGQTDALLIDSTRGIITFVLGMIVYKKFRKQH